MYNIFATFRLEYRVARRSNLTSWMGHRPMLSQNLRSNSLSIEEVYVGLMRQNGALKRELLKGQTPQTWPQLCWKWSLCELCLRDCPSRLRGPIAKSEIVGLILRWGDNHDTDPENSEVGCWGNIFYSSHMYKLCIHRFESCEWCAQTRWEVLHVTALTGFMLQCIRCFKLFDLKLVFFMLDTFD